MLGKEIRIEKYEKNISLSVWNFYSRDYVMKFNTQNQTFEELIQDDDFFRSKLTQFLFSPRGAIYQVKEQKFS